MAVSMVKIVSIQPLPEQKPIVVHGLDFLQYVEVLSVKLLLWPYIQFLEAWFLDSFMVKKDLPLGKIIRWSMFHSSGTVSESQNCEITVFERKKVSWWYSKHFNTCGNIPNSPEALFFSLQVAALISSSVGL